MGVYEDMLGRIRMIPDAAPFPEPPKAEERDPWDLPRLADLPQTLLPPHLRNRTAAVDASAPGVQMALGNAPQGPSIPREYSVHAGMLPPLDTPPDQPPFLNPIERQMQLSVGGDPGPEVPIPAPRPPEANTPDAVPLPVARPDSAPGATDVSARAASAPALQIAPPVPDAAAAAATPPAAAPASPFGMPSILDKIRTTLGDNSNALLAIGAGFAGAPNWGQAISRAASAAIPARAADIKQKLALQSQTYGTKALVDAGVPVQQAIAAQGDPDLKKALIQSYITDRGKDIQMIKTKDPWGGETEVPYVKNKYPKDGEPVLTPAFKDAQGNAAPVPGSSSAGGTPTFAPGITAQNFDHTKVGDEYLAQFSPEMQSSVKAYLAGRALPTGRQLPAQMLKAAALKYGDDIGMPGDDASIGQRKQWSNSLADTKSGIGLQSKGFQQGLEHFVKLSDNLVKMNLSNGLGLEPIAGMVNSAKNLTTEQQELVHKNDVFGQALAREMGNLFAKNGGGVHEAAETKKNVSNATMSSKSAAGSLEAIDELMQGGLRTLEQRRDELFPGGNAPKGSIFLGPRQQAALEHIRRNVSILKGEKVDPEAAPAPAAAPIEPTAINKTTGARMVYRGGQWQPLQ